jgi:putative dimethyl sulfoxide reductase chaperone
MESIAKYSTLLSNRENLYRFFARLYSIEVDDELFTHLSTMGFPAEGEDSELNEGYRMLADYLRLPGSDQITDLAEDYKRIFLGTEFDECAAAYPYESAYGDQDPSMIQQLRDEVSTIYHDNGFDLTETNDIPEDHIALELEYMAYLCHDSKTAMLAEDWKYVCASLREQKSFLNRHLLNWTPEFCADIQKCAATNFYKAIAKITHGFLCIEQAILEDLADTIAAGISPSEPANL